MSNSGCRPLSDSELKDLHNTLALQRDKVLLTLGTRSGFRISELLSLEVEQMLQYGNVKDSVTVQKSKTKGKVASRSVPLSEDSRRVLDEYIKLLPKGQKYLFESQKGNKLSRVQAWRTLKNAANKLELKGKIACHSTRKTFAAKMWVLLEKDLVMLQRALGHESINSSSKYVSFLESDIHEAIKTL